MSAPPYPFSAVVGQEELKLALLLAAVDPRIGGVLVRGQKGTAKTTLVRGLAAVIGDAPFVELPIGATEDRLLGTFDLKAALTEGERRFVPGLLHAANGGVLYVDEVNLLPDHLADLLLDAAATGVVRTEREGLSVAAEARFVLVGSMNPEEGELRPQLLDRFGLAADAWAPKDPAVRAEAVRRRLAYDADPAGFCRRFEQDEQRLRSLLANAKPARVPEFVLEAAARLSVEVGAEGLRADLVMARAVAALAGLEGRAEASVDDLRRVARLALAHRRRRHPLESPGLEAEELEAALARALEGVERTTPPAEHEAPAAHEGPILRAGQRSARRGAPTTRHAASEGRAGLPTRSRQAAPSAVSTEPPEERSSLGEPGDADAEPAALERRGGARSDRRRQVERAEGSRRRRVAGADGSDEGAHGPGQSPPVGAPPAAGRSPAGGMSATRTDGDAARDVPSAQAAAGLVVEPRATRARRGTRPAPTPAARGREHLHHGEAGRGPVVGASRLSGTPRAIALGATIEAALERRAAVPDVAALAAEDASAASARAPEAGSGGDVAACRGASASSAPLLQERSRRDVASKRGAAAGPLLVELGPQDLREPRRAAPRARLVVLAVDASGSMGAARRMAAAKGAAVALLLDAYRRRDRVALVAFRGEGAEVLLRPTGSVEVARARLAELTTGGATPLAAGLCEARSVALGGRAKGLEPLLVVLSDGRATWAASGADPLEAALAEAREVAAAGLEALVVDAERSRVRLGLAERLADCMRARLVRLEDPSPQALAGVLGAALANGPARTGAQAKQGARARSGAPPRQQVPAR